MGGFLVFLPLRAGAQIGPPATSPTIAPTLPPETVPPETVPPTAAPTTTVTTRRATTSTVVATTRTIRDITVPTVEPDPADVETAPPPSGGGTIHPIFALLSVAGFATFGGILFRQWRATTIRDETGHSG
jgi:hypothetical protein